MASSKAGGKVPVSKQVTESIKPWSKQAPWWILAIEAVVALGVGIYVLMESSRATTVITYALAAFLLVDGLLAIVGGLRGEAKTFGAIRGGVGLLAGIVLLLMPVFGYGSPLMAGWLIGLALIVAGLAGLLSRLFEAGRPIRWIGVLVTLLMIALGGVYIYSVVQQSTTFLNAAGWILVAVGLALGVYAGFTWNEGRKRTA
jgi:uncharacterized membrane protein HdeD (DUF308 family)